MNTRLEAASERAHHLTDEAVMALLPMPCRYRSLDSLLDAATEAAAARERAEAAPQTLLPFVGSHGIR